MIRIQELFDDGEYVLSSNPDVTFLHIYSFFIILFSCLWLFSLQEIRRQKVCQEVMILRLFLCILPFCQIISLGVSIFLLQFEVFIGISHDSEIPLEVFPLYHHRASAVVGMKG